MMMGTNGWVTTDQDVYYEGDDLVITIRNRSDKPILMYDKGWFSLRDTTGMIVYNPNGQQPGGLLGPLLRPGETATLNLTYRGWSDSADEYPVRPGEYAAVASFWHTEGVMPLGLDDIRDEGKRIVVCTPARDDALRAVDLAFLAARC